VILLKSALKLASLSSKTMIQQVATKQPGPELTSLTKFQKENSLFLLYFETIEPSNFGSDF